MQGFLYLPCELWLCGCVAVCAGGEFSVRWDRVVQLPFFRTDALRNPLNEDKPVKLSRDGQELWPDIGLRLCQLFDEAGSQKGGIT